MLLKKKYVGFIFCILSLTTHCDANNLASKTSLVVLNDNALIWKKVPSDPNLQYSVLAGNPNNPELFTIRLRLPKNYTDKIHQHPTQQYDTIISGSYYLTHGDQLDKSAAIKLDAGTFILIPANLKHIGWTNEDTIMQITTMGPWQGLQTKHARH